MQAEIWGSRRVSRGEDEVGSILGRVQRVHVAIRPELTTFGKLQLAFKGQRRCIGFRIWCKMKTPLQAGARCNQLSYDEFGHDLVVDGQLWQVCQRGGLQSDLYFSKVSLLWSGDWVSEQRGLRAELYLTPGKIQQEWAMNVPQLWGVYYLKMIDCYMIPFLFLFFWVI